MKEGIKIVQMRGTIFLPENIGYTADNANKFQALLMPNGTIGNVFLGGNMPMPITAAPQWGGPWCLTLAENGQTKQIMFLPNKIDIIAYNDNGFDIEEEQSFVTECNQSFNKIIEELGGTTKLTRLAYAPLLILEKEQYPHKGIFDKILNVKSESTDYITDRDVTFTLKREVVISEKNILLNLLHKISDGYQTIQTTGNPTIKEIYMLQLDINTVVEQGYKFEKYDIGSFFDKVIDLKNSLIDNL